VGVRTVTVTNTDAQSGSLVSGFNVQSAALPPPVVTSVTPPNGAQDAVLTGVLIAGSAFQSGATCSFGAGITVNSCVFNSPTQLTAALTIAQAATTGVRNVTVTNPDTQAGTLTDGFTVTPFINDPPTITSVTPNVGTQGTSVSVEIVGTGFLDLPTCNFGAGIANTCIFNSSTSITASVTINGAAAVGPRTVTVTNQDAQSGSLVSGFSVQAAPLPPPAPTSASPNTGAQGATLTAVVITGSAFQSGATCNFGASITINSCVFNSPTQITANVTLATNTTLGLRNIAITNPDGQIGTAVSSFTVTPFVNPVPTVTSISPTSAQQGATTSITITGTGFLTGPTCSFGTGVTVNTCNLNSATSITSSITVGAAASPGARTVTVTNTDAQVGC